MATSIGNEPRSHTGGPDQDPRPGQNLAPLVLGISLVAIGALLLMSELSGVQVWRIAWPFFLIVPGVLLFVAMFSYGTSAGPLAIPACIVTTTGLILLIQNTFGLWQTWAYAWALVAPTSVGLGQWLFGVWSGQPDRRRAGVQLMRIGLILFVGFAAFFELILNISGLWRGVGGSTVLAVVLIVLGTYLLVRSGGPSTAI